MITIEPTTSNLEESLSRSGLTSFLNRARLAVGLRGEVEVLLSDDSTLRRLNKSFRGKNKPTDVLSFPAPPQIKGQPAHAGDLAISLETAARQADSFGHPLRDEVRILLLHGLLHLSGLDHETDNGEMATRESHLRRQLRLPNTLIERVQKPLDKTAKLISKRSQEKHKPGATTRTLGSKKHNSRRTA
jgi:probable rRNA maturation factor